MGVVTGVELCERSEPRLPVGRALRPSLVFDGEPVPLDRTSEPVHVLYRPSIRVLTLAGTLGLPVPSEAPHATVGDTTESRSSARNPRVAVCSYKSGPGTTPPRGPVLATSLHPAPLPAQRTVTAGEDSVEGRLPAQRAPGTSAEGRVDRWNTAVAAREMYFTPVPSGGCTPSSAVRMRNVPEPWIRPRRGWTHRQPPRTRLRSIGQIVFDRQSNPPSHPASTPTTDHCSHVVFEGTPNVLLGREDAIQCLLGRPFTA